MKHTAQIKQVNNELWSIKTRFLNKSGGLRVCSTHIKGKFSDAIIALEKIETTLKGVAA